MSLDEFPLLHGFPPPHKPCHVFSVEPPFSCPPLSSNYERMPQKLDDRCIELLRSLKRSKVTHSVEEEKSGIRNGSRQMLRVFAPDEFVVLALSHGHRYTNLSQIFLCIVGLRPLHKHEVSYEVRKALRS
jgi:hypothetical protein